MISEAVGRCERSTNIFVAGEEVGSVRVHDLPP